MTSRQRCASAIFRGVSSQRRSLPCRTPRTRPAPARTCRCLVIACRLSFEPPVSRVIDKASPRHNWETRCSRVSSPSAAKMGAVRFVDSALGGGMSEILVDPLQLRGPALVVHLEGLGSPRERHAVEAAFGYTQQRSRSNLAQRELHPRKLLGGVVDVLLHRLGVPAGGESVLGLHLLDLQLQLELVEAPDGHPPLDLPAGGELAFELHAEPGAELRGGGERLPDPRAGGAQLDLLL